MTDEAAEVIGVRARPVLFGHALELRCGTCGEVFTTVYRQFAEQHPYAVAEDVRKVSAGHVCKGEVPPDKGDLMLELPKEHRRANA